MFWVNGIQSYTKSVVSLKTALPKQKTAKPKRCSEKKFLFAAFDTDEEYCIAPYGIGYLIQVAKPNLERLQPTWLFLVRRRNEELRSKVIPVPESVAGSLLFGVDEIVKLGNVPATEDVI